MGEHDQAREDAWDAWAEENAFDHDALTGVQRTAFRAGFDAALATPKGPTA